jgi:Mg-chelatase subunit ChlD
MSETPPRAGIARWRLALGRFARGRLEADLSSTEQRMERALEYLYAREYAGRGVRQRGAGGTLDETQLAVPRWLAEVRDLFPSDTFETITRHALERYEMTEIVKDPATLARLEPSFDLLRSVLALKGKVATPVLGEVRRIVHAVVEEMKRRLETEVRSALSGSLDRFRRSRQKLAANLDWRATVRTNLKHYDPERRRLVVEQLLFFSRVKRRMPWRVIMCVDQSGSMASSVIHSAVLASIFAGLPALEVKLVVFDTAIVDLSDHTDDPVEVLMSVQLGGGTNIAQALTYCEQLVTVPRRTILVLISDFEEGGSPRTLVSTCRRLAEAGVRLLGLASLDEQSEPWFDRQMAERLAAAGMEIAALTPRRLAEWVAGVIR